MWAVNLLSLVLMPVVAQWIRLPENGIPRPPGLSVHVATFDEGAKHYWIHGGSSGTFVVDLWSYDMETGTWDKRQQLNQPPSPRGDHVAVWDPNTYTFWVHGGYDSVSYFGDLWKYSGYTWTNIAAAGPSPRSQHVAVWDASSSAIWIHGGLKDCVLNQDLWKFDTQAGTWTSWPSSQQQPVARANHVAIWDDANRAIWIHAGYNRACGDLRGGLERDLWRFDTTANSDNWNFIARAGPTARAYHVAGWDPTNEAIWIHGGLDGANFCRDLWRFDTKTYEWHLLSDHQGPSGRFSHAAAFDVTRISLCVHGGYSDGRLQSDLWCYQWTTTTTSRTTSITITTSTSLTRSTSVTSSSTSSKSSTSTSVSTTASTSTTLTSSTTQTKTSTSTTTSISTSRSTSSTSVSSTSSISMSTTSTATETSSTSTSYTSTSTSSTSYTSTSSTQTSSTSKTSSSSSTTLTISSSTSSTRTISTSTSSSTTQTITTSTSSTITVTTTTTTTPEDLTAFYILCPLFGLVIVALVTLSLLYVWRYCKAHRFVVLPVSQVAVPQAYLKWPEAPPFCPPPVPPPVEPPQMIPINIQQLLPPLESPLSPLAHSVPSEPQIQLTVPDLRSPGDCETSRLSGAVVRISIAPDQCAVSPAQPIVEVLMEVEHQPIRSERQPMRQVARQLEGLFGDVEASQRCVSRETQQAPMLPRPNDSIVLMPFVLQLTHRLSDLGPRIPRIAGHMAPKDTSLALDVPDLQTCTEPSEAFRRQQVQSTPPMVRPQTRLSHPVSDGPSLVNVLLKPMVQATARLPAAIQETPILPHTCIQLASCGAHSQALQMPLEEPPPPTVNPKGTTSACECAQEMELTPISLHVSIPCALDRLVSKVQPSEPRAVMASERDVALSTPTLDWPSAPKPQHPLQVSSLTSFEMSPESPPTSTVIIPVVIPASRNGGFMTEPENVEIRIDKE